MKKIALAVFCLIAVLSVPSFAYYTVTGPLSEGQILSDTLKQGQMELGANIEYFSATDTLDMSEDDPAWGAIGDDEKTVLTSFNCMTIPLRFSYGLSNNVTGRITLPIVSMNLGYTDGFPVDSISGSGIGDARVEVLWQALNETESAPELGINFGVKLATGSTIPVRYESNTLESDYLINTDLATGTGANDITLSAILKKTFGAMVGKASLTYVKAGIQHVQFNMMGIELPGFMPATVGDHFIYSVAGEYQSEMFTAGAELWGINYGKASFQIADGGALEDSEVSLICLNPYASFNVTRDITIKGVVEVPLSQSPTYNIGDVGNWQFKGMNIIVGATMTI